jgi:hypothetical protein
VSGVSNSCAAEARNCCWTAKPFSSLSSASLNAMISGLISLGRPSDDNRVVRLRGVIRAAALDASLSDLSTRRTVSVSVKPKMMVAIKIVVLTMVGIGLTFSVMIALTKRALVAVCA